MNNNIIILLFLMFLFTHSYSFNLCKQTKCDHCKSLVGDVENIIFQNSTYNYVQSLCNELPSRYILLCNYAVIEHYNQIISIIKEKYNPEIVCKQLKNC